MVFDLNLKCNVSIITSLWTPKGKCTKKETKRIKFGQTSRPWDSLKELLLFCIKLSYFDCLLICGKTFQKGQTVD